MEQELPSSSVTAGNMADDDDEDLQLDNEEVEIARLELPAQSDLKEEEDDERIPKIEFHCGSCDMHEMVHYYGKEPPFALGVKFREDNYVMRDPFQAPPPRWQSKPEFYIALGVNCSNCSKVVCKDITCSFYYTKTYCLPCGTAELKSWPVEAQARLRKQVAAKQSCLAK